MTHEGLNDILDQFESQSCGNFDMDQNDCKAQASLYRERYKTNTRRREHLAKWTMWCVSVWLGLVILIIIFNSLLKLGLSDSVLITLLGTTTLNVIGLAAILLRGYFNSIK